MNFTDGIFFLFLPLVLLASFGVKWKNKTAFRIVIIVSSSVFYGYWDYRFLGLLYFATLVDWIAGIKISQANDESRRKIYLLISLVLNLGILFFFKYCNFFIDNLRDVGVTIANLDIVLPVGISFYTFQTMSYTIDVYRRHMPAEKSFLNFLYFTIFFPQLVAGPIVRADEFLPQIQEIPKSSWRQVREGGSIFITGLIKKLLFADTIAPYVDHVFHSPEIYSTTTIWLAVIAYTIQIFCDFSGYTDMAIGIAKMFGHELVMNFNLPYISRSITEFWRRWHMSLSRWIRDYIYISLGGNKKGRMRTYFNLLVTMLLGGLWHGASWNFILWGGLHGAALAFERFFHLDRKFLNGPFALVRWLLTLVYVMICWVFFRAKDLPTAIFMLKKMFMYHAGIYWFQAQFSIVLSFTILFHIIAYFVIKDRFEYYMPNLNTFWGLFILVFVILGIIYLNPMYYNPFIYFQF